MLKRTILLLLTSLSVLACLDEIAVPIRDETPRLVVEGLVTNSQPPYYVRLSYTGVFTSATYLPDELAVNGAKLTLTDDRGQRTDFRRSAEQNGLYETTNLAFIGTVGRSYTLLVVLADGKTYRSEPEVMPAVAPVSSLTSEFLKPFRSTANEPPGFQIYVNTQDPAQTTDYYRWTARTYTRRRTTGVSCGFGSICNTSCWVPTYSSDVNIYSDQNVNGSLIRQRPVIVSPAYTFGNHLIEVKQYSMTRKAYQFWQRYKDQLDRTGTIFDPLPSSIDGNLISGEDASLRSLGYFGASAVSVKHLTLETGDQLSAVLPPYEATWIQQGACTAVYAEGTQIQPTGW